MGVKRPENHSPAGGDPAVSDVPGALLATKLSPPVPVPDLLARSELVARLAGGHEKLSLISAPAGWGKSSLLAAWYEAGQESQHFAFLRLEQADDDLAVFWVYVLSALRTVAPELMPDAEMTLRMPGVEPMRRIVPELINELSQRSEPVVLILDDYHLVTGQTIHASVQYLIEHLPPPVRLVIATRSDPPLPLSKLRASSELLEIRADQLRLTSHEASQVLRDRFALDLEPALVGRLCSLTEGWPAAIHLAGLSMHDDPDPQAFVDEFAGDDRNVADYLTSEVLARLPSEDREFLLRTSVLERFTAPLCDHIANVDDSASKLESLERRNLFLIPLDHRRLWYRYHRLFADWLRHELQRRQPGVAAALHDEASRWYAQHGSLSPAITHALAADNRERATQLMDQLLWDPSQVSWSSFWGWLDNIPDNLVAPYPTLASVRAVMALVQGDAAEGTRWVDIAQSGLRDIPEELRRPYEQTIALYRAFAQLAAGNRDLALDGLNEAVEEGKPTGSFNYAMAIGLIALFRFWSDGPLPAIPTLLEAVAARERASAPDGGVTALLAAAYAEIGDLTAAETTARAAFTLPRPPERYRFPDLMGAHYALGSVAMARGERQEAAEHIEQGLALARPWNDPVYVAYGVLLLADARDDYTEKRALVREARQLAEASDWSRIGDLVSGAERRLSLRQPPRQTDGTVHVEALTDRELDVIRLLTSELSLREIAGELYISLNTVKGYTKSIYRKLGVSSREAAIEAARDQQLL